mmetsp:Transcript_57023/g.150233  ORF Transcript_57023/g.150233 Transcript_57023/m.150233 type:complete len:247 (-) Transcript_57023:9-749(-)
MSAAGRLWEASLLRCTCALHERTRALHERGRVALGGPPDGPHPLLPLPVAHGLQLLALPLVPLAEVPADRLALLHGHAVQLLARRRQRPLLELGRQQLELRQRGADAGLLDGHAAAHRANEDVKRPLLVSFVPSAQMLLCHRVVCIMEVCLASYTVQKGVSGGGEFQLLLFGQRDFHIQWSLWFGKSHEQAVSLRIMFVILEVHLVIGFIMYLRTEADTRNQEESRQADHDAVCHEKFVRVNYFGR